jgi:hypothetical protein
VWDAWSLPRIATAEWGTAEPRGAT